MHQGTHKDPAKGHLHEVPKLNTHQPLYQPTQITRKVQNQIMLFQSMGVFAMVYGSTCFKESIGFDLQFTMAIMMTFAICNHPSNSNLNPMVTLSFCLRHTKRYQIQLLWIYFKAQFLGAFLGVFITYLLNGVYRAPLVPQQHTTAQYLRIALSECVGVFILCLLVLQVVGPNSIYTTRKFSRYIYIALMVYIGRRYTPTSGTALNAWITLARALIGILHCDFDGLKYFGLWVIGDIAGCLLATGFYNLVVQPCIVHARVKKMIIHQREQQLIEMEHMSHEMSHEHIHNHQKNGQSS